MKAKEYAQLTQPQDRQPSSARECDVFFFDVSNDVFDSMDIFGILIIVGFISLCDLSCLMLV